MKRNDLSIKIDAKKQKIFFDKSGLLSSSRFKKPLQTTREHIEKQEMNNSPAHQIFKSKKNG